jgi:hypothetical protein
MEFTQEEDNFIDKIVRARIPHRFDRSFISPWSEITHNLNPEFGTTHTENEVWERNYGYIDIHIPKMGRP